jgi:PAS domain S-box-containing protein
MTLPTCPDFLAGEGDLRARIRAFDWSTTPLGPLTEWSEGVRTVVSLVVGAPVAMVLIWGSDGYLLYNDAYAVIAGNMHPEVLGRPVVRSWPEVAEFNRRMLVEVLAGRTLSFRDEPMVLTRGGAPEHVFLDLDYSPVRDADGTPVAALAMVRETTARVVTERRLRDSESRLTFALKAGRLGEWTLEWATLTLDLSATCKANFGRAPDAPFTYEDLRDTVHPEDQARMRAAVDRTVTERADYDIDYRVVWPDGTVHWVSVQARPVVGADGALVRLVGVSREITERKRAEGALRALNESLEARVAERTAERDRMWRLSLDLLLVVQAEGGGVLAANPAWERLLGWTEPELLGTPIQRLMHPEDLPVARIHMGALREQGAVRQVDVRFRHKDGRWRWISWSVVETAGAVLAAVGRDVTAEREAREALKAAESALRQSQKMEAVGQLTGGIAHDFNNLLQGIMGSLGLMRRRVESGRTQELERFITSAMNSAQRAAALTHRLLAYSRMQPLDPRPVEVNPLVASLEDLWHRTLGERMALTLSLSEGLWLTRCDANQLETALLNLVINARDAMPDGGRLTVETRNARWDGMDASGPRDLKPGEYVSVSVSDTGTGMTPEVLERAFDPFFTTKPLGQGTGLGLSMIYGFARQSEGGVALESAPGRGTTVRLYLPRHVGEGPVEEAREGRRLVLAQEAGETVLVVEDETVIRALIVDVLRELGYRVLEAGTGPDALKVLRSARGVDLLVTDMGLPGLDGREVATVARAEQPGLKVLFITGYAESAAGAAGFLAPGMTMLTKPFAMEALVERIQDMLQRG